MQRSAIVLDTDGGVDDCVALWFAATDPRLDLAGVLVTWGNVDVEVAAANVRRVLHAAGRGDVPVAVGAADPIGPSPLAERSTFVHGEDGMGGHAARWPTGDVEPVAAGAAALLARLVAERPGELTLVTIGPLSTAAGCLDLVGDLAGCVVMGGAVARPGNALPLGEANIAHDPLAAAAVVGAPWPAPPLLVGLDATLQALLTEDDLALAAEGRTPAARMLAGPLVEYAGFYARSRQVPPGRFACHDLLAVLAVVEPEVLTDTPVLALSVDTGGSAAWGATVADRRPVPERDVAGFSPWRVALGADADRFRATFRHMLGEA